MIKTTKPWRSAGRCRSARHVLTLAALVGAMLLAGCVAYPYDGYRSERDGYYYQYYPARHDYGVYSYWARPNDGEQWGADGGSH